MLRHGRRWVSFLAAAALLPACGDGGGDTFVTNTGTPPAAASGWEGPLLLEGQVSDVNDSFTTHVAVNATGFAVAVWDQSDGTRTNIWANHHHPGRGWGIAELIETSDAGAAQTPRVAVDPAGNAMAVWSQSDGTRFNIWANRFVAGVGWGIAGLIETEDLGGAFTPQVAMDSAGNAIAVWVQSNGVAPDIFANRFTVLGGAWESAGAIDALVATVGVPCVALDAAGTGIALWHQNDISGRTDIWSSRLPAGGAWTAPDRVETDDAGNATQPSVGFDGSGVAIAVWQQSDGVRFNIRSARRDPGGPWGASVLLETENAGDASESRVAVNAVGQALAVWNQWDGTRYDIWSNRYVPGTGWTGSVRLEDYVNWALFPEVGIDAAGNGIAVWQQGDSSIFHALSARFTVADGWAPSQPLGIYTGGTATSVRIAVNPGGIAFAVWSQTYFDGASFQRSDVWANRYR